MSKRNRLTFLFLGDAGSPVKQVSVSKRSLGALIFFLFVCLIVSGFVFSDYIRFKTGFIKNRGLEKTVSQQNESIADQRKQIEYFAKEINSLKSNLVALNEFEKKIKVVANIEEAENQKILFGVGGSIPEDLDPEIVISNSHNNLLREMHGQVEQLQLASIYQRNSLEELLNSLKDRENLLACTPSIRPTTGWISSGFGYRKSPFTGKREFHKGLDIATGKGTKIIATGDGVITFTGKNGLLGKMMIIDHGHGMVTRYAHIDRFVKKQGEFVKRGEAIALVGNSGRSTGSHLHYEVLLNGVQVNPNKYILN